MPKGTKGKSLMELKRIESLEEKRNNRLRRYETEVYLPICTGKWFNGRVSKINLTKKEIDIMNYQVLLNDNQKIDLINAEFDATSFKATLNDQKINFVNIGGAIINKHIIISVLPISAIQTETQA